jgi:tetratricopeptide (TPR) repeat protein
VKEEIKPAGALRTRRIVGRARELAAVRDAIEAEGELCIVYIIGEGGTGKTRLLEQVPQLVAGCQKSLPCRYVGPFDLYQSSLQSVDGLERALTEALDSAGQKFQSYREELQRFEKLRAGADPQQVEQRQKVTEGFIEGFNEVSGQTRVVITLDTLEIVQYESDTIQKICDIEKKGLEVKDWLLDNLLRLNSTVIVMASREKQELVADFKQHLGDRLTILPLGPFSESETLDYFAAITEVEPAFGEMGISRDQQCVIHHYTAGHPLKLALVLDLLARNLPLPQELFDPLETARQRSDDELEIIRERIEGHLATGIMTADRQIDRALPYIALARKGMNRKLLGRLTRWTPEMCTKVLSDLQRFSFVKIRAGDEWLFLHDEMYDLVEKHVWNRMEAERAYVCRVILDYYDESTKQVKDLSQRQNLMVEQLYYELLADPKQGYARYVRLSDAALFRHDEGFDMRLRDEVLRFCGRYPDRAKRHGLTGEFIDYDSAVRWVKRSRYTSKYEQAVKVAEEAKAHLRPCPRDMSDFGLTRADLDVSHALALIYTGEIDRGVDMLREVIADLEGESEPERLAYLGSPASFKVWRRNLVLGQAHNNLGYVCWMNLGHYHAALDEFLAALPYFLASGLEEEIANTYDNMGRVYALLGAKTRAELLIRNGLEIRRRLGREFRIALSLNSQAIVHWNFDDIHRARRVSEQALHIFEGLGASRGVGLARITLGRSLRRLGALWQTGIYSPEECHKFLDDAIISLQYADERFSEVVEPVRLVEIHNELGCAHRERAALLRSDDLESLEAREEEKKSEQCLKEAVERAEGEYPVLYVDSCEDLARTYFQRKDFSKVEEWLNRAAEAISSVYKIKEGSGVQEIPSEGCVEEFWWQMGKVEMLHGHMVYDRESNSDGGISRQVLAQAMRHYALAAAYFERYSEWAVEMRVTSERLYDNFRRCRRDDLQHLRAEVLPSVASAYHLDASRLQGFFKDTLGLALQIAE